MNASAKISDPFTFHSVGSPDTSIERGKLCLDLLSHSKDEAGFTESFLRRWAARKAMSVDFFVNMAIQLKENKASPFLTDPSPYYTPLPEGSAEEDGTQS